MSEEKQTLEENKTNDRRSFAFTKSIVIHLFIIGMLLFSFDFSPKPQQLAVAVNNQPDIIEATFIDSNVIEQNRRERQQAEAAAKAKAERQRRIKEQERKKRAEREKRRKQKALEEQRAKEEAQRQERERRRIEAEREEEAKRKAEEEKKRIEQARIEAERRKKEEQERQARAAAKRQFVLSETDKYIGLIKQVIQRNLIFDSSPQKRQCRLNIRMSSNGLVFDVRVLEGDSALCRAAQAAVLRPDSLPVSNDPDVYEKLRDFNLTVEL